MWELRIQHIVKDRKYFSMLGMHNQPMCDITPYLRHGQTLWNVEAEKLEEVGDLFAVIDSNYAAWQRVLTAEWRISWLLAELTLGDRYGLRSSFSAVTPGRTAFRYPKIHLFSCRPPGSSCTGNCRRTWAFAART